MSHDNQIQVTITMLTIADDNSSQSRIVSVARTARAHSLQRKKSCAGAANNHATSWRRYKLVAANQRDAHRLHKADSLRTLRKTGFNSRGNVTGMVVAQSSAGVFVRI